MTSIQVSEATYVDPRAGNDKFYRVFVFGNHWVTQYGRNNTVGTFTKVVVAKDHDAATAAAAAKFTSKVKKGYNPSRSGVVTVDGEFDTTDLTVLDTLAEALPAGDVVEVVSVDVVEALDLGTQPLPDQTAVVAAALSAATLPARDAHPDDAAPSLPVRPMLASVQPGETVADAMASSEWFTQFKYDGDRVVIEISGGEIRAFNRQGQAKTRNVGTSHLQPLSALRSGRWVLDGEVVGRTLVLFDLAAATDATYTWVHDATAFADRYRALTVVADILSIPEIGVDDDAALVYAPIATTEQAKADMLTTAANDQREGIILRHRAGAYEPGRRSTTLIKHKLVKDADVVISALHPVKQSAELSVVDGDGELIVVGSASTIGKVAAAGPDGVQVGQVWVVTFLYVTDPGHPRLTQPRLVARRHDKTREECRLDQFADAGTNKAV